ncbi:MAG: serine/threonine protein kinase, partial [Myxococcales bacterium]|nr:serine/threonine protein kinase [Myxococcales bacterium]
MAAAPEQSRRRWGRYESICEIASGGMATVHLARDLDSQRLAAVKSLHPHLMADDDVVQNFIDENHIVSRICHPNVVPVLEVAQNDAGYYQAMEYVDGAPLGKLLVFCIRGGSWLSIEGCARVALDTLEGLDAAHELKNNAGELTGVVHRDVGPANILVDVFGMARVIDFGVATMAVRYTAPGSDNIKGRLAYMAPEQAKTPKDVDRRADLFSVGVVLWELLAARRLFKGKSEKETLENLLGQEIPSLGVIREDVEPDLEAVVRKALERDPAQRFQTA